MEILANAINVKTLTMLFAAVAAAATVLTLAMPLVFVDQLDKRMRAVAIEREKIRQRERERMAQENQKVKLRQSPQQYVQTIVDRFNLSKWVGQEEARLKLVQAGYRGQAPYITYLFVRMVTPVACFLFALVYLFFIIKFDQPNMIKLGICIGAAYVGMQLPLVLLKNKIQRRQLSVKRAFPDTLDLLLICVESGMSIEAAFRKVSDEVGTQSVALAEELTLTTAELSYLPDRRQAYENLAKRTNLDGVKSVCMALQQSERYGTPLGTMLRVMAQENRDMRMSEAEKKAAGLPPKLTVPMILFFLPVLVVVILGAAVIKVMRCSRPRGQADRYRASAIGSAVVDLIRSIAKRDVTFFSGTVAISFL
jgi:tight adherence protein C